MPKTLPPIPPDAPLAPAPNRKRWTRQDCEFLEKSGLLTGRYELIDGEIIIKMGQNVPHMMVITLMAEYLRLIFGSLHILVQGTITLEATNEEIDRPEPDVVVLSAPITSYKKPSLVPADLLLVVEVSDTTLAYDLRNKAALYARAGIAEYWVVDIVDRRLIAHRQPGPLGYSDLVEYAETETLSPQARPDAGIAVADLLPPQ